METVNALMDMKDMTADLTQVSNVFYFIHIIIMSNAETLEALTNR